jgi:hypothetical protein
MCFLFLVLHPAMSVAGDEAGLLDSLRSSMAEVRSVQARFVQEKSLAMLQEPLRSEGRLYYQAPDDLRWEYTVPEAQGFSVRGSKGWRWWPSGEHKPLDLKKDPLLGPMAAELLVWVKFDLKHIQMAYGVEVLQYDPPLLRLRPRAQQLRRVLDHLDIAFTPDGRSVLQVDYLEPDGDTTSLRFLDAILDARIPDGVFLEQLE